MAFIFKAIFRARSSAVTIFRPIAFAGIGTTFRGIWLVIILTSARVITGVWVVAVRVVRAATESALRLIGMRAGPSATNISSAFYVVRGTCRTIRFIIAFTGASAITGVRVVTVRVVRTATGETRLLIGMRANPFTTNILGAFIVVRGT
jgi:alcohol dehydrogenase YqhD (iron-dependent ADH family)